jgi:hypothetical protein
MSLQNGAGHYLCLSRECEGKNHVFYIGRMEATRAASARCPWCGSGQKEKVAKPKPKEQTQ